MTENQLESKDREKNFFFKLFLVLLFASVVRLINISNKDLCFWDEGIFLMGSKFLHWRIPVIYHEFLNNLGFSFQIPDPNNFSGYPVFLQKPVHVVLLYFSSLICGQNALVGIYHSVFYSLITIFFIAVIGKKVFDSNTGLVAALWLSLEPYHVHYSRLGLHEMDSMALLLGAILFWIYSLYGRNLFFFITGVFLMASFGASYRIAPFLMLIPVFDVYLNKQKKNFRYIILRLSSIAGGYLLVFAFLNMLYFITFYPDYLWSQPASYVELLRMKFFSSESSFDLKFPFFYAKMFLNFDGIIPLITLLVSMFWTARNHIKGKIVVLFFVVPLILFSVTTTRLARTPTSLLPFGALSCGYFLSTWHQILKKQYLLKKLSVFLLTTMIFISFATHTIPILKINSGYQKCIAFLKKKGAVLHLSTMKPIYAVYLGNRYVSDIPWTIDQLYILAQERNIRYISIDWQKYVRYPPSIQLIESKTLPVFAAKNEVVNYFATLYENYLPEDVEYIKKNDPTIAFIKIYDLKKVFEELNYSPDWVSKGSISE